VRRCRLKLNNSWSWKRRGCVGIERSSLWRILHSLWTYNCIGIDTQTRIERINMRLCSRRGLR
jgi:hypothetical protein